MVTKISVDCIIYQEVADVYMNKYFVIITVHCKLDADFAV